MKIAVLIFLVLSIHPVSAFAQDDIETLIKTSEELRDQDKADEAIAQLTRAIAIQPENAELYKRRAELHYGSGNSAAMIPDLIKAAQLAPDNDRIVLYATNLLNWAGKFAESLEILNAYVNTGQPDAEIYARRSSAKMGLQDPVGAYDDLAIALEISPGHTGYQAMQAEIISKLGDSDKAFELYDRMIDRLQKKLSKLKPNEDDRHIKLALAGVYYTRSRILHDQGNTEAELAEMAKYIQYAREFHNYQLRARIYVDHQMYDEAIADYTEAIRVSDHPPTDSLIPRAEVYVLAERYAEAIADYETVLKRPDTLNRKSLEQRLSEIRQMLK